MTHSALDFASTVLVRVSEGRVCVCEGVAVHGNEWLRRIYRRYQPMLVPGVWRLISLSVCIAG